MRRRVREAYRLNHRNYNLPEGTRLDLAFIYVADKLRTYAEVERAVCRLLSNIQNSYEAVKPD
jgi:hypothetical protein